MVGTVGGEGVERGSWSTAGEGVPGIADPAARGQFGARKDPSRPRWFFNQGLRRWIGSHESWLCSSGGFWGTR